ncbi:MAG TPA: hypothetical protein VF618_28785 [Thermoanaerobaculia bacterium]
MPAPHRLSGADAHFLLAETFRDVAVEGFRGEHVWAFLQNAAVANVVGGAVYDAVILQAARDAGATMLMTFNARDFERFGVAGIDIIVPA